MATEIELTIRNPTGLHARPAATFVRAAAGFRSTIGVENLTTGAGPVPARSLIAVLSLGAGPGHQVRLTIDGEDAEDAATALAALIRDGLGEAPMDAAPRD